MPHRTDYPRSDTLHPDAAGDRERADTQGAEDPLVELARIVNRNRLSAAQGRVEATDYFAGLEDEDLLKGPGGEPLSPPAAAAASVASAPGRFADRAAGQGESASPAPAYTSAPAYNPVQGGSPNEPAFDFDFDLPKLPSQASHDAYPDETSASEPFTASDLDLDFDRFAADLQGARVAQEAWDEVDLQDGTTLDADTLDDFDVEAADEPYVAEPHQGAPAASPYQPLHRSAGRDTSFAVAPQASGFDVEPEPAALDAPLRPSLDLSADLEKDLAAGLEDELLGAFQAERRTESQAVPAAVPAAQEPEGFPFGARKSADAGKLSAAPPPFVPDAAAWSALTPDARLRNAREASAGFAELDDLVGSLFEDERLVRKADTAPVRPAPQPDDIDDMAWPDALNVLPREEGPLETDSLDDEFEAAFAPRRSASELPFNDVLYDDDEAPPPPGGYDLDAVARAMQESDPTLAGAGVLPPHSAAEATMAPREQGSRKGLYIAAAVLGVAGLGGILFAVMDTGPSIRSDGTPPVIAGLEEPLKTFPAEEAAAADAGQPAKLIYDRVGNEERMLVPQTPAPAQLPPAPADVAGAEPLPAGGPKKVRTLVVRPDGTIISGGSDTGSATSNGVRVVNTARPDTQAQPEALTSGATAPLTGDIAPATSGVPAIVAALDPQAVDGDASEPGTVAAGTPRPKPASSSQQVAAVQPQVPASLQPQAQAAAPEPAPALAPPPRAASSATSGPLNLTQPQAQAQAQAQAQTQPAALAATATPGAFAVQVTSQRTQDQAQAAYAALQRKFPSVLGGQSPLIEAATLDNRGTFYRVSIPAGTRDAAISFCESLKAAGGDCFVRRN